MAVCLKHASAMPRNGSKPCDASQHETAMNFRLTPTADASSKCDDMPRTRSQRPSSRWECFPERRSGTHLASGRRSTNRTQGETMNDTNDDRQTRRTFCAQAGSVAIQSAINEAVRSVAPFYWKPIRCLQRSIVTARLMQRHGIPAEVVIGYRAILSHAWVEVGVRAANDSPTYRMRLLVLERL